LLTCQKERIRLLVHILCELRISNGVTARRLKEAEQSIRRQISPAERLQLLDELYEVREAEEKFLDGATGTCPCRVVYWSPGNWLAADGTNTVSILRANLPDTVEAPVGQGERSRKSTPTEEDASRQPNKETASILCGPLRSSNIQQPLLAASVEMPTNIPPSPRVAAPTPSQYIHQELPIHPGFEHTLPLSPQDLKRKRAFVEVGPSASDSSAPVPYYPSVFVGSQPFLPEGYDSLQGLQRPGLPVTDTEQPGPETFGENMDIYGFPYYDNWANATSPLISWPTRKIYVLLWVSLYPYPTAHLGNSAEYAKSIEAVKQTLFHGKSPVKFNLISFRRCALEFLVTSTASNSHWDTCRYIH